MSSDIILIEPIDKNASIPPILKIMYDFIAKCVPIISENKLKQCGIDVKEIFNYQSGLVVDNPRWVARTGLLSIAAYLENHGYQIDYLPLNYLFNRDYKEASTSEAKWLGSVLRGHIFSDGIVGITCTTPEFNGALKALKTCKAINPNILTVIGGYHVTFQDVNTLRNEFVDVVVRGEGENAMLEIAQIWDQGKDLSSIRGISYRDKKNNIKRNPDRAPADLKLVPLPAYHLLPKDAIKSIRISIMLSRGCPHNCSFCVESKFWNHRIRYRPLQNIVDELEYVKEKFTLNFVHIADSSCDLHSNKITEFCDYLIKNNLDIYLSCNIRADSYKFLGKLYNKMKKAGFIEFLLGIESGSNEQLKRLNKGITFNDALTTLKILKKQRIPFVRSYWMIGAPGENHVSATETVRKLDYLYSNCLIYDSVERIFIPYPGLTAFEDPTKHGIKIMTTDWDRYKRFSFPPVHHLTDINEYEMCNYTFLMKSIQVKHYAKWANMEKECYDLFADFSDKHFWKVIPP